MTEKLAAGIDEEMARLEQQTEAWVDEYWQKHWAVRAEADRTEWGYIGVRARTKNGTLEISWYRAKYWQHRNKVGEKREPTLEHLEKGQGYSYTPAPFRRVKAKQWEIDKAMELEIEFASIRRQAAMLGKMRRYLHEYRKAAALSSLTTADADLASDTPGHKPEPQSGQDQTHPVQETLPAQDPPNEQAAQQVSKRRPGSAEPPIQHRPTG